MEVLYSLVWLEGIISMCAEITAAHDIGIAWQPVVYIFCLHAYLTMYKPVF